MIDVVQATQNIGRMNLDDLTDSDPDDDPNDLMKLNMEPEKSKWDCESIISLYSVAVCYLAVVQHKFTFVAVYRI